MKKLLVVHHSQSGSTAKMANAVLDGANDPAVDDVDVRALSPLEATAEDLLWCDGFILGTPENFGYMSGAMKYFLDRVFYDCVDRIDGKPYALFVRAGNDGSGAVTSLERILAGLNVRQVQAPLLSVGDFDPAVLADCETLGMTMAAGLSAGIF